MRRRKTLTSYTRCSVLATIAVVAALAVSVPFGVASAGAATVPPDSNASSGYVVVQGDECVPIEPLGDGSQSVEEFYDYRTPNTSPSSYSYSSHGTTHLQADDTSSLFLYEGGDGLSLVLLHDQYNGNSPGGAATMLLEGLPEDGEWVVEDDSYAETDDVFEHRGTSSRITWVWAENRSDGAVFNGGLDEEFSITVDPAFNDEADFQVYDGQISDWRVISATDGGNGALSLAMDEPLVIQTGSCVSYTVTELDANETVTAGESTGVEATVENDGALAETFTVPFTVENETVDEREVTLEPGETTTLSTTVTFDETGTYTVGAANATTDVTVEERDEPEEDDELPGFSAVTVTLAALLGVLLARYRR